LAGDGQFELVTNSIDVVGKVNISGANTSASVQAPTPIEVGPLVASQRIQHHGALANLIDAIWKRDFRRPSSETVVANWPPPAEVSR